MCDASSGHQQKQTTRPTAGLTEIRSRVDERWARRSVETESYDINRAREARPKGAAELGSKLCRISSASVFVNTEQRRFALQCYPRLRTQLTARSTHQGHTMEPAADETEDLTSNM